MTVAYQSWGANAPSYPELVVSFPDGSSRACQYGSGSCGALRSETRSAPERFADFSLRKSIELGEQLVALLEQRGAFNLKQRGPKSNSVRALAKDMRGVVPPSSMWRAIAIYQLSLDHPEITGYRHLGVAHLSVLLTLKGRLRLGLLRKSEAHRWSRRALQRVANCIKQAPGTDWAAAFGLQPYLSD